MTPAETNAMILKAISRDKLRREIASTLVEMSKRLRDLRHQRAQAQSIDLERQFRVWEGE